MKKTRAGPPAIAKVILGVVLPMLVVIQAASAVEYSPYIWGATTTVIDTAHPESIHSLYENPAHPEAGIKYANVLQGGLGDCYFMAALAAVANADPGLVHSMITDNLDGTYTVKFPGLNTSITRVRAQ